MSTVVSLFLLSQVFLIVSHGPLVRTLANVILKSELETIRGGSSRVLEAHETTVAFLPPKESLEKSLENLAERPDGEGEEDPRAEESGTQQWYRVESDPDGSPEDAIEEIKHLSVTDEEKEQRLALESPLAMAPANDESQCLSNKPFLETILNSLYCVENDYTALFALCLLYALANNPVSYLIAESR